MTSASYALDCGSRSVPLLVLAFLVSTSLAGGCTVDDCRALGSTTIVIVEVDGWPTSIKAKERLDIFVSAEARSTMSSHVQSVTGQLLATCNSIYGSVICGPGAFSATKQSEVLPLPSVRIESHFAPHEFFEVIGIRILARADGVSIAERESEQNVKTSPCQNGEPGIAPFRFSPL